MVGLLVVLLVVVAGFVGCWWSPRASLFATTFTTVFVVGWLFAEGETHRNALGEAESWCAGRYAADTELFDGCVSTRMFARELGVG